MKNVIIFLLLFVSAYAFSQQSNNGVTFKKTTHNFGSINEADGEATYRFEFVNKTKVPAIILKVKPSCDCTSPGWSKAPISPGATGYVSATYDPHLRHGSFDKSIAVTFADKTVITLHIKGDVIPKKRSVSEMYKYKMGDFLLNSSKVPFAKIKKTEKRIEKLKVYNSSKKNMKISFANVPAHLNLKLEPTILKPGQKGVIKVTYDAKKKKGSGFLKDKVSVLVNGKKAERSTLYINATVEE